MLKVFILSLLLLNFTTSRSLPEGLCEAEIHRWKICFGESGEENQTNQDRTLELKESLKCVGEIKCNGFMKILKFNLDSIAFAREQFEGDAFACINGTDKQRTLTQCIFGGAITYNSREKYDFDENIVKCTERVLEETKCSVEDKKSFMRAAMAMRDMSVTVISTLEYIKNGGDAKHFDKIFEPTQYF